MTAIELFKSVGFVDRYYSQMSDFYRDIFSTEDEMIEFFVKVFRNDAEDKIPRQMMNQIQQLVSIANDIDQIRPARDPLRIFFIKTCLEALCSLSKAKKDTFYNEFPTFMSTEGKDYILSHFTLSYFDEIYRGLPLQVSHELTINEFFEIIKVVRNIVAHEGNYWEMQFFTRSTDDTAWLSSLETDIKILESQKYLCEKSCVAHTILRLLCNTKDLDIISWKHVSVSYLLIFQRKKRQKKLIPLKCMIDGTTRRGQSAIAGCPLYVFYPKQSTHQIPRD